MGYVESNLSSAERVVGRAKFHWIHLAQQTLKSLLLAVLFGGVAVLVQHEIYPSLQPDNPLRVAAVLLWIGLWIGVGVVALSYIWFLIVLRTFEFVVTNRRLIYKRGLIRRDTFELRLAQIESIQVQQSVLGRILGFGALHVVGSGGSKRPFPNLGSPITFRRKIEGAGS